MRCSIINLEEEIKKLKEQVLENQKWVKTGRSIALCNVKNDYAWKHINLNKKVLRDHIKSHMYYDDRGIPVQSLEYKIINEVLKKQLDKLGGDSNYNDLPQEEKERRWKELKKREKYGFPEYNTILKGGEQSVLRSKTRDLVEKPSNDTDSKPSIAGSASARESIDRQTEIPIFACPICMKTVDFAGYSIHMKCWDELREDLENAHKILRNLTSYIDHHTNDRDGDQMYIELVSFFKKYLGAEKQ